MAKAPKTPDWELRNQRRSAPLETITVELPRRRKLKVPTVGEMLRIKAYVAVERNATRDYLDVAALSHHMGLRQSEPHDLTEADLREYKGIVAPWNDWHAVKTQCRALAVAVVEEPPQDSSAE